MADAPIIDVDAEEVEEQQHSPKVPKTDDRGRSRPTGKRKRRATSSLLENLTAGEKEARVEELEKELNGLLGYYREVKSEKVSVELSECGSRNAATAVLMEESELPLSELVEEICERLRRAGAVTALAEPVTRASVKSSVVSIGQRIAYGVPNAEADVLEDNSECCFWCWETRDVKLIPESVRGQFIVRRICRGRIHERIVAVTGRAKKFALITYCCQHGFSRDHWNYTSFLTCVRDEMISSLKKPEIEQNYNHGLMKASTMLCKVYNEADIRFLVCGLVQKISVDMDLKKVKREEKLLLKQLDINRREVEVKDSKMLRGDLDEASKEEKCNSKDVCENKKQKKKQQGETERDRRRREKEESELKKKLSLQKQASIMERFLKRSKPRHSFQNDQLSSKSVVCDSSIRLIENLSESATLSMDSTLASSSETTLEDIRRSHYSLWHDLGKSIRSNKKQRWGIRWKPKSEFFKELKLASTTRVAHYGDLAMEKHEDRLGELSSDVISDPMNSDNSLLDVKKHCHGKQLLQFDNSPRPAFYGIWSKKSQVVGPRHPFRKEPSLDYDVNSEEEWEEEDPGESLSDCDKDEEECVEECSKSDDESDNGFFVPDGYLSEDEGAQVDKMKTVIDTEGAEKSSSCEGDVESEEFCALLRQQKYLNSLTENALKRNHPLIITNLMHGKELGQNFSGAPKLEQMCLQSLSMRLISASSYEEIAVDHFKEEDQDASLSAGEGSAALVFDVNAMLDSNLSLIVATIQAYPQGIDKVLKSLQQMFPSASESLLRDKVLEISDYVDNRLQVKKDVLVKLGRALYPDKGCLASGSTATFVSGELLLDPLTNNDIAGDNKKEQIPSNSAAKKGD